MVDVRRSQSEADGMVFGHLGVKISGTDVWTTGQGGTPSRCLGPLAGAYAGLVEPRRSWFGTFISSLLVGDVPPKKATMLVAFADGTRYERLPLPFVTQNWPKIAGEIGRFNAAAYFAHQNSA
jgi:hypothetical protein